MKYVVVSVESLRIINVANDGDDDDDDDGRQRLLF